MHDQEQTPPSHEAVERLKANWLDDPCWDIETTTGFEMYRDELLRFRQQEEARMKAERLAGLKQKALEMGLTVEQVGKISRQEFRASANKAHAARTLWHLLSLAGIELDREVTLHREAFLDQVVDCAKAGARVDAIKAIADRQAGLATEEGQSHAG